MEGFTQPNKHLKFVSDERKSLGSVPRFGFPWEDFDLPRFNDTQILILISTWSSMQTRTILTQKFTQNEEDPHLLLRRASQNPIFSLWRMTLSSMQCHCHSPFRDSRILETRMIYGKLAFRTKAKYKEEFGSICFLLTFRAEKKTLEFSFQSMFGSADFNAAGFWIWLLKNKNVG